MTAEDYANAIVTAELAGNRSKALDLWEDVAANANSTNRLYEAVDREVKRVTTPYYTTTGKLFRVTETAWFLADGSRGGYGFRGTKSANAFDDGGDVVYIWPKNGAAERDLKRFVAYVEACITELVDAYGLDEWRKRGEPNGPIG